MTEIIEEQVAHRHLSRRTFLKGGGALIVAFGSPLSLSTGANGQTVSFPFVDGRELDSWLRIGQDGKVTVFTGRVDSGQHKQTSFGQIVAEELDVPFAAIEVVMGDTALVVNQGGSTASDGLLNGAKPLRHAAAEARRVLMGMAATKLGVPVAQLTVSDGVVSMSSNPSQKVTYGELIGNGRLNTRVTQLSSGSTLDIQVQAKVKDPSTYKVIGKSIASVAIPHKVRGTWGRVHNIRVAGMLHARVVLPPSPGAHLVSVDGFAQRVPDLVKVVSKGDFLAVVAKSEWGAIQAMQSIKVSWNETPTLPGSGNVFKHLRTSPPTRTQLVSNLGNVEAVLSAPGARTFSAQYNFPAQMHGMIGPNAAVADVRNGIALVWTGTQVPFGTQSAVANILGIPPTSVRLQLSESSGAYGRLGMDDAAVGAAFVSQQVGKPVRLQWMRQQEHAWSPQFPPYAYDLRAGVDGTGKIVAWEHKEYAWGTNSIEDPRRLVASAPITATGIGSNRPPGGGEVSAYDFGNFRQVGIGVPPLLRGLYMRSPGRIQVNFAGEQFLDEIASATRQDPIAMRLRHLADNIDPYRASSIKPPMTAVLEALKTAANWETRPSPGPGASSKARVVSGRGVSLVASQRSAYVANVAEVEVDKKSGKVRVTRFVAAVDAGQIVNPRGIRAQIEGAIIYAVSRALHEQVTFDKTKVLTSDWVNYPILRFNDIPDIEIVLLNRPDVRGTNDSFVNSGIGEPPNTTPPAAIGNAIFDATGVRVRQLPYTPARMREALKAAGAS
jgi:CO/xanthine dehydrogenase Mo-binding subunit